MLRFESKILLVFLVIIIQAFVLTGCSSKKMNNKKAMLLYQDGLKFSSQGDFDKALEKFNHSIDVAKENGFTYGVAHNYNEIGNIYTYKKEYTLARDYYQQALAIYQEKNMSTEVSKSLDNIAKSYLQQGYYGKSLDTYDRLIAWDESHDNLLGKGIVTFNMALIYERYIKDFDEAEKLFSQAYDIFFNLGRDKEKAESRKSIKRVQILKQKVPRD